MKVKAENYSDSQLIDKLTNLKVDKVDVDLSVSSEFFMENLDLLHKLENENLVKEIQVLYDNFYFNELEFIEELKTFNCLVLHVVEGIFTEEDFEFLHNNDLNIKICGFTGSESIDDLINNRIALKDEIEVGSIYKFFKNVSFDDLARINLGI